MKAGPASATAPAAFALLPPAITPGQTATANVGTTLTLNGATLQIQSVQFIFDTGL